MSLLTPASRHLTCRAHRHAAIDPALLRVLLASFGVVLAIQVALQLCDFDYLGSDPFARARVKIHLGKFDEAERIYRIQTISNPEDARGWLGLGDLLLRGGRPDLEAAAAQDYQYAAFGPPGSQDATLRVQPERMTALRQAGLLAGLRGQAAVSQGLLDQAAAGGDRTALRSTALVDVVRSRPGADQVLQQALIASPGDPALLYCVAAGWQRHGHAKRAQQVLAALESKTQPLDAQDRWRPYCLARYRAACGDLAGAAAALDQARQGGVDAGHLEDALPLTRAEVFADPAFLPLDPRVAEVLRLWRELAPLQVAPQAVLNALRGAATPGGHR